MDSTGVSREIRRIVWPVVREHGFTRTLGRSCYRDWPGGVDVLNFQSCSRYIADGVGCTTHSFGVNLGLWLREGEYVEHVRRSKAAALVPHEYACDIRGHLAKGLWQPWFRPYRDLRPGDSPEERVDVWYVKPNGENLDECILDALEQITVKAMPWFDAVHDLDRMARALDSADAAVAATAEGEAEYRDGVRVQGYEWLPDSLDEVTVALLALSEDHRDLARDIAERAAAKETKYVAWKARAAAIAERCLAAERSSEP